MARVTLTTRVTKATYDKVVEAARISGRSRAQEIELALERALWIQDVRAALGLPRDEG